MSYCYLLECKHIVSHGEVPSAHDWDTIDLGKMNYSFKTPHPLKAWVTCPICEEKFRGTYSSVPRKYESRIVRIFMQEAGMCDCFNDCNCRNQWDGHEFWIVLSADGSVIPGSGRLSRYTSKVLADNEAKRLAAQERKAFLVLETVDGFQPPERWEQVKFKKVSS